MSNADLIREAETWLAAPPISAPIVTLHLVSRLASALEAADARVAELERIGAANGARTIQQVLDLRTKNEALESALRQTARQLESWLTSVSFGQFASPDGHDRAVLAEVDRLLSGWRS